MLGIRLKVLKVQALLSLRFEGYVEDLGLHMLRPQICEDH